MLSVEPQEHVHTKDRNDYNGRNRHNDVVNIIVGSRTVLELLVDLAVFGNDSTFLEQNHDVRGFDEVEVFVVHGVGLDGDENRLALLFSKPFFVHFDREVSISIDKPVRGEKRAR
ncbi:hypothetical protein OGATHE_006619 [Ogataea polymorpha]|uniref:Uncharacterized protein n=1 Tax=Ogataea polymorpha TaxID=460523 RepID=A0A9P8SX74_9ASCO|nr:hypothetical protein OGATHE_006619 [Ogataea polymorpha]